MTQTETQSPFQVARIQAPKVERGKFRQLLVQSPMLSATVHVLSSGGENNLHAHANIDSIFLVLAGEIAFHTTGDELVATLGPQEMVFVPRGTPYWFESSGAEQLVVMHIWSTIPGALDDGRIDLTERKPIPMELGS